jgi:hypothetical protein
MISMDSMVNTIVKVIDVTSVFNSFVAAVGPMNMGVSQKATAGF